MNVKCGFVNRRVALCNYWRSKCICIFITTLFLIYKALITSDIYPVDKAVNNYLNKSMVF